MLVSELRSDLNTPKQRSQNLINYLVVLKSSYLSPERGKKGGKSRLPQTIREHSARKDPLSAWDTLNCHEISPNSSILFYHLSPKTLPPLIYYSAKILQSKKKKTLPFLAVVLKLHQNEDKNVLLHWLHLHHGGISSYKLHVILFPARSKISWYFPSS